MEPPTCNVVYVDRRATKDRAVSRSSSEPARGGSRDADTLGEPESHDVRKNVEALFAHFPLVNICTSGPSCLSLLADISSTDSSPTLLLLDIPYPSSSHPGDSDQPDEAYDVRHDSGIAPGPADPIYGIALLRYICNEVEDDRLSKMIVPVALLPDISKDVRSSSVNSGEGTMWIGDKEEERITKCVDFGAVDVLTSPFSKERTKSLFVHCYRAGKRLRKSRKRSWAGDDGAKFTQKDQSYSHLREKMVSELMADIFKPTDAIARLPPPEKMDIVVSPESEKRLKDSVGKWDFCATDFNDDELLLCAYTMFQHAFGMPEILEWRLDSEHLMQFLQAVRTTYNPAIPYHNFRHCIDVLQVIFYSLLQLNILPPYRGGSYSTPATPPTTPVLSLSKFIRPFDALALMVAAVGHDVGHPGVNNAFLITLKAPLAQMYNDRSVLESFHCAAFSQVLRKYWPGTQQDRVMRHLLIDAILATDMGVHFDYMSQLGELKKHFDSDQTCDSWTEKEIDDARRLVCLLLIKVADISNVARPHKVSCCWAKILTEEWKRQSSMEKDLGIPSSIVAAPSSESVSALAKSQTGFIDLFAMALFKTVRDVLPEMEFGVDSLYENRGEWDLKLNGPPGSPKDKRKESDAASNITERPQPPELHASYQGRSSVSSFNTSRRESNEAHWRDDSAIGSSTGGPGVHSRRSSTGSPLITSRRASVISNRISGFRESRRSSLGVVSPINLERENSSRIRSPISTGPPLSPGSLVSPGNGGVRSPPLPDQALVALLVAKNNPSQNPRLDPPPDHTPPATMNGGLEPISGSNTRSHGSIASGADREPDKDVPVVVDNVVKRKTSRFRLPSFWRKKKHNPPSINGAAVAPHPSH